MESGFQVLAAARGSLRCRRKCQGWDRFQREGGHQGESDTGSGYRGNVADGDSSIAFRRRAELQGRDRVRTFRAGVRRPNRPGRRYRAQLETGRRVRSTTRAGHAGGFPRNPHRRPRPESPGLSWTLATSTPPRPRAPGVSPLRDSRCEAGRPEHESALPNLQRR